MSGGSGLASWQHQLNWMEDDDEQDSDTDSKLSGSAIVDSMMKRLRKHGHYRDVALDPISSLSEHEDEDSLPRPHQRNDYRRVTPHVVSNGFSSSSSPVMQRRPGAGGSPSRLGEVRKKDALSPVPETTSFASSELGSTPSRQPPRPHLGAGPAHRSLENLTPPSLRRDERLTAEMGRGYRPLGLQQPRPALAFSHDAIPRPAILDSTRFPDEAHSDIGRTGSLGSALRGGRTPPKGYGRGRSGYEGVRLGQQTPPSRRMNYERRDIPLTQSYIQSPDVEGHERSSSVARSDVSVPLSQVAMTAREPNLHDVVGFLGSEDVSLVANAASYLQHLAYGDDHMKAKIRQSGAVPVLLGCLHSEDSRLQLAVLGALRNLSSGRANDDNKLAIAGDAGLQDLALTLHRARTEEVREMLTGVVWNLSSCEKLKLPLLKTCLADVVSEVLLPCSGWSTEQATRPLGRPTHVRWSLELRNATGTLRNTSSAGEASRVLLRSAPALVDCLLWLVRAAVLHRTAADEKAVENVVCVLRNLSYGVEGEVDPQAGAEDTLDPQWEREQRLQLDEEGPAPRSPGCLPFCTRPRPRPPPPTARPLRHVDFANPDAADLPRRQAPVLGVALLWQPEVVYLYLAVTEHFAGCWETLEGAVGAIQNLTACSWKWAVYSRALIRSSGGLRVMAELLNNGQDTVVRAAATALRNLAAEPGSRTSLGALALPLLTPRLPFSSNHLGLSEQTSLALLCCLLELCSFSPENARLFRELEGVACVVQLSYSRQHTPKTVFAASKVCSVLYGFKECRSALRQSGWDQTHFQRLARDSEFSLDPELGSISRDFHGSGQRKWNSRRDKGSRRDKSSRREKGSRKERQSARKKEGVASSDAVKPPPPGPLPPTPAITDQEEGLLDPCYSLIPTGEQPAQRHSPSPLAIYQTVGEAQEQPSDSLSHSAQASAPSPATPPSPTEPDPNATYALVDMDKKRASRRQHEGHTPNLAELPTSEAVDSWV